jgi:heat-inducible transcriptional repressor
MSILSERARTLLKSLIEHYLQNGEPVASRTLSAASKSPISSATVRTILAELEERGYICSPHTSAGRLPTKLGLKIFVENLMTACSPEEEQLALLRAQLSNNFQQSPHQLLLLAAQQLAKRTKLVGLASFSRNQALIFKSITFVSLDQQPDRQRLLVVLVINDVEVQHRVVETARIYAPHELIEAQNYLNYHCSGQDLRVVRANLIKSLEEERAGLEELCGVVLSLGMQALEPLDELLETLVLVGKANLFRHIEQDNIEKIRSLVNAFEEKQGILSLLEGCLSSNNVQIFIGEGDAYLSGSSIIAKPYRVDGSVVGVLGVIGPTRIPYAQVVPWVENMAEALEAL